MIKDQFVTLSEEQRNWESLTKHKEINFSIGRKFLSEVKKIPSGTSFEERLLLYSWVRYLKPKIVLELGAWYGASTIWLAQACKENGEGKVFVIDNFSQSFSLGVEELFRQNIIDFKLSEYVDLRYLNQKSEEVKWDMTLEIDFMFLDGGHSYTQCKKDFEKYRNLMRQNGLLIIHDYVHDLPIKRFCDENKSRFNLFTTQDAGFVFYQKS